MKPLKWINEGRAISRANIGNARSGMRDIGYLGSRIFRNGISHHAPRIGFLEFCSRISLAQRAPRRRLDGQRTPTHYRRQLENE
jgi:hypothetical protein